MCTYVIWQLLTWKIQNLVSLFIFSHFILRLLNTLKINWSFCHFSWGFIFQLLNFSFNTKPFFGFNTVRNVMEVVLGTKKTETLLLHYFLLLIDKNGKPNNLNEDGELCPLSANEWSCWTQSWWASVLLVSVPSLDKQVELHEEGYPA